MKRVFLFLLVCLGIGVTATAGEDDIKVWVHAPAEDVIKWMKDVCYENGMWTGLSYADFKAICKEAGVDIDSDGS